jgi:hypothetical protein
MPAVNEEKDGVEMAVGHMDTAEDAVAEQRDSPQAEAEAAEAEALSSNLVPPEAPKLPMLQVGGLGEPAVRNRSAEMEDEVDSGTSTPMSVSPPSAPSPQPMGGEEVKDELLKDHHTLIIFDWDDTLLASSFLSSKGYSLDSPLEFTDDVRDQLRQLDQCVSTVLRLAMRFGDVCVITNAETGWVQLSAQKFMPGVVPLLSQLTVISARSTFEPQYPNEPLRWKMCAFQEQVDRTSVASLKMQRNVLSFGDSHVEREAVHAVTRSLANTKTKSVKFAERPSMEQLRRQIELVTNCFQYIYTHDGDLDLMLTISLMY